jgi:peptidoglycan/LPS O-acetylase OafA/YrhL
MTGVYPPWGKNMSDGLFALATAYRLVFSVLGCYVIARLAPDRPMAHAMVGGAIGLVLCIAGAVSTWNMDIGPHWYSVLLAVTALPCAWIGGKLWQPLRQTT